MSKKIIIAGGGTGGHIFPAIAIANAIKRIDPSTEILFIGAIGKMEMEKVPHAGYRIEGIPIAGFQRGAFWKNLRLPLLLIQSFLRVRNLFRQFRPDAAIGVGGYSTFPVLRYAQFRDIPTFIHESNSFAGKSNMLLAAKATRIFVASGGMEKFFPKDRLVLSGNPVRREIVDASVTKKAARNFFGLEENKCTVLAIGGSLGAGSINEVLAANLDVLNQNGLQLIWQTGQSTAAEYSAHGKGRPDVWVGDFIQNMATAYAAADVIISRSGSTIYELCVAGKPAILVPFPLAADDHQSANAKYLVEKNAAILIKDSEVRQVLIPALVALTKDPARMQELARNISALAITNADDTIAHNIMNELETDRKIK